MVKSLDSVNSLTNNTIMYKISLMTFKTVNGRQNAEKIKYSEKTCQIQARLNTALLLRCKMILFMEESLFF